MKQTLILMIQECHVDYVMHVAQLSAEKKGERMLCSHHSLTFQLSESERKQEIINATASFVKLVTQS